MFPVFLDLTGRLVLVVGGGPVGRRKAAGVRAAGGLVRLVCLESRPADLDDQGIDWRHESYAERHLEGVALAFAAGPAEVNARVASDARARGVWGNVAGDPMAGDVYLPAVLRHGGLVVAVTTGGAAPALARQLRDHLEEQIDPLFAEWVALLAELRPIVLQRVADEERRRELFERLAQWSWLDRLRSDGVERVRAAMRALVS
jgi:precorrin-2 dehydrogenase/sirohydrochlorin ferrochelatase